MYIKEKSSSLFLLYSKIMKLSIPVLSVLLLATNAQSYTELKPNFVDKIGSKNFAFVGLMGGSSHFNWVLSIGNQLCERGHNFTFIASVSITAYDNKKKKKDSLVIVDSR